MISLADTPCYHITSRCVPKTLRGAGSALRISVRGGSLLRLTNDLQYGILFSLEEYLALVDWTGRIIRSDKRGHIDSAQPPILNRLQITAEQWHINAPLDFIDMFRWSPSREYT